MSGVSIAARAEWLADANLQRLLAALSADGEEARIAGGAVRNTLLGEPVSDIDIATTTTPDETEQRAQDAGFRTVPTGKEHGTITVIADGRGYEVTTLRADVETDGRHARVAFGKDWKRDAERRDFTINALYARANGEVVDLVGGLPDLETRTLRFIGDADARIREDYLRILRFFRFFAWYGKGRPDADGLRASARLKDGLARLSAERIWSELKKLLSAPDPSRALLWMRQAGVLTQILPESEKWGIDAIHGLIATEKDLGWQVDPMLRLASLLPPVQEKLEAMAERLRMSKAEAAKLTSWAAAGSASHTTSELALSKQLYLGDVCGTAYRLKLALAAARARAQQEDAALVEAGGYSRQLKFLDGWTKPAFPINGGDLLKLGAAPGKAMGESLKALEKEWMDSGFRMERDALLARAAELIAAS
ncbi:MULTISPECIES: CCA tRNA nucleotidyltransferase [unclassified Aminobacter]|uniref:CCA tRNA nucleotidyltransferase n=1 Tax=unclassified Aminobacter TaxID=2644704 RepID=UPI000463A674|nr:MULTISPECIES: CCA tRNA nucleotidyltransferase [unclassified Aminobacter]TWG61112.1 poly(A) polymerase/tRNA nucleotidyltransferase (CCA-adding enzyme) [Aminobacter sp. J44]TWH31673.1 poly(A) polymerase/tRNA nucleotidyltransferase (CCA-adding enzyme) [Aminobacter sp. J15]